MPADGRITDPDAQLLANRAASLAAEYVARDANRWAGSPFAWLMNCPSRSKGAIAERLVEGWCADKGFTVERSPSSEADRVIEGHQVEIKLSTLWASGVYRFQQVRNQDYEHLFCLGISPWDVHAWLLPKPVLLEHVIGHTGQHTGASGQDTAWIGFKADSPHPWMAPYGPRLGK